MKTKLLVIAVAAAAGIGSSGSALADSTYGFSGNGSGAVSATAAVTVNIKVPKVIVLRVGAIGAIQSTVDFVAAPDIQTAPGVVATTGGANAQPAAWNAVAPALNVTGGTSLTAYLWHNNNGNAQLTCSASALAAGAGFTLADILVSNGGLGLGHPGADATCGTTVAGLARNTLHNASWAYSVNAAGLTAANPGAWTTTITYTATTL